MHEDRYFNIENTPDYELFTFSSKGRHGEIIKIVRFEEVVWLKNTFNLALGTISSDGEEDFESLTNNGDRNKVLATVAIIISKFIETHPRTSIYIAGSDIRRTLLYQRAIAYAYEELIQIFNIFGDVSPSSEKSEFEVFDKLKIYNGFLIRKK
jgi:hypothetical protein